MVPAFVQAIGTDRFLTLDEVTAATGPHPAIGGAWDLYGQAFGAFAETSLDPLFHRLHHPATSVGSFRCHEDDTVLVVGNGPSARRDLSLLHRWRRRLHVITSPRGAELLAAHDLVPDLVLIEHRTALDAHHSVHDARNNAFKALTAAPLVAADWRTPAPLLAGVSPDRLFVPDPLPTWGFWPATAVALAANAGARRIGLLGIDLGTETHPDPSFAPLSYLLSLLAQISDATMLDCGAGGAVKAGWEPARLEGLAGQHDAEPLLLDRRPACSMADRLGRSVLALKALSATVQTARDLLSIGLAARAGAPAEPAVEYAMMELLSWQKERRLRVSLQEDLGLSFLPRLWRTGVDLSLGQALWRPLVLASHELVGQADRLQRQLEKAAA